MVAVASARLAPPAVKLAADRRHDGTRSTRCPGQLQSAGDRHRIAGVDRAHPGRHVGGADRHRRAESRHTGTMGKVPMDELAGLKVPPFTSTAVMLLPLVPVVPPKMVRLAMLLVLLKFTVPAVMVAAPNVAAEPTVVRPPPTLRVATLPRLTVSRPPPPPASGYPIVAAPMLVAALPNVTLPPLIDSVPAEQSSAAAGPAIVRQRTARQHAHARRTERTTAAKRQRCRIRAAALNHQRAERDCLGRPGNGYILIPWRNDGCRRARRAAPALLLVKDIPLNSRPLAV